MSRRPLIRPWQQSDASEAYDLFVATVGFEARSRSVAEMLAPKAKSRVACAFPDRKILSYEENMAWFVGHDFTVEERRDDEFRDWFLDVLRGACQDCVGIELFRVCIDISSTSRLRLAIMIDSLRRWSGEKYLAVDFIYSIAKFSAPVDAEIPNAHVGPVLKSFAGWSVNPNYPTIAIVGLGYEENKALGAVEHLQVSQVWAFFPTSPVKEYEAAVASANRIFFDSISTENIINYRAEQPFDCFVTLESLAQRCLRTGRVVLLPFGPKIFSLCSLMVACIHSDVAVWRVSAGGSEPAVDRIPSSYFCGLTAEFQL